MTLSAQNIHLLLKGTTPHESRLIDSIGYVSKHKDTKSAYTQAKEVSTKLSQLGYLENNVSDFNKQNDSTYASLISIGKQTKYLHLFLGTNETLKKITTPNQLEDSLFIPFSKIQTFLDQTLQKAEQKGLALTELKLDNIKHKNGILYAEINFKSEKPRTINQIVANYYNPNKLKDPLPKGHIKQLNKKYKNQIFNKSSIEKIYRDFEKFRFLTQTKYPETLLLKDTTKIYVYLEKRQSNTFDGYIGFNTDDNSKLTLNGYLDLTLENTIKTGETFSIYWKSDGNNQKTFRANLEIPYLFNSNFIFKSQLHIFKQDSIFQNTKTTLNFGYLINYNTRLYIGRQSTESSNTQITNTTTIQDYNNSYWTSDFEYHNLDYERPFFPEKTTLSILFGIGKRSNINAFDTTQTNQQHYINTKASYTFECNKRNFIYVNQQNFYLKSNNYLINELYRFGGTSSIRGFTENRFQAHFYSAIQTEYRYIVSPNLYLHSIVDYALYKDPLSGDKKLEPLTGVGFGIGLQTKNGLLKIALANGIEKAQKTDFYNTIISLNYNIHF
ncbi:membrane protein [Flavobacterium sp. UMI-01]|nr:membrane protein [Flavobacterium sp. UMI-01]